MPNDVAYPDDTVPESMRCFLTRMNAGIDEESVGAMLKQCISLREGDILIGVDSHDVSRAGAKRKGDGWRTRKRERLCVSARVEREGVKVKGGQTEYLCPYRSQEEASWPLLS